ncbi:hypothetical protein, partial [Ralstonia sp. ASV6]|uniref:hypothetical protein n=1 Tax=Ralstonia sp. ASV6 TaxID=2795124 RepID=UPI001E4E527A
VVEMFPDKLDKMLKFNNAPTLSNKQEGREDRVETTTPQPAIHGADYTANGQDMGASPPPVSTELGCWDAEPPHYMTSGDDALADFEFGLSYDQLARVGADDVPNTAAASLAAPAPADMILGDCIDPMLI